jgi:periplasmic protein CpxP/Spy
MKTRILSPNEARSAGFQPGARLLAAGLLAALLGSAALSAWAQPMGDANGGPPMHAGMGMMMAGHRLDHLLASVNATADQRTRIKAIAEAARSDLKTLQAAGRSAHQQVMTLLAAPTIDAAAIETLRVQISQQHDQASRRITQALIDASNVLSPDQRKQLADRAGKMRDMMQRHLQERRALDGAPAPR